MEGVAILLIIGGAGVIACIMAAMPFWPDEE